MRLLSSVVLQSKAKSNGHSATDQPLYVPFVSREPPQKKMSNRYFETPNNYEKQFSPATSLLSLYTSPQ